MDYYLAIDLFFVKNKQFTFRNNIYIYYNAES